jgi:hypothetical protein
MSTKTSIYKEENYMKQLIYISIISAFLLILMNGCASIPQINSGIFEVGSDNARVKVAFNDHDRRIIHDYYQKKKIKHKGLPPGLAKKRKLPPGLQKQLKRNGSLPPGLAKRSLPYKLEERLSRIPRGYVRLKVGGDIILMNKTTEVIVDIIHDIG